MFTRLLCTPPSPTSLPSTNTASRPRLSPVRDKPLHSLLDSLADLYKLVVRVKLAQLRVVRGLLKLTVRLIRVKLATVIVGGRRCVRGWWVWSGRTNCMI